jgi:citrate synthase
MTYIPGLKGVIATETNLSSVDGEKGELIIAGYPLEEIAPVPHLKKWPICFGTTVCPQTHN